MTRGTGLLDTFGRLHDNLRVSVTDRCNIRCFFCMPEHDVKFVPREEILSFEEIERFVRIAVGLGIKKVRITGGEPLVRKGLDALVGMLRAIAGVKDLALTTNGVLLAEQAEALYAAGLRRLNVHLDTLDRARFARITRRDDLARVLEGLAAAKRLGFGPIKINAVAVKGLTEPDIVPLARFGREHGFEIRFIEFMPLDAQGLWDRSRVLTADEIVRVLSDEICAARSDPGGEPARARHRVPLCGRRGPGGLHRLRQPSVLRELQPRPPDRRRQAALLPVRHRGDGHSGGAARRRDRRRDRRHCARHGVEEVGRPRNQHRPLRGPAAAHVRHRRLIQFHPNAAPPRGATCAVSGPDSVPDPRA